MKDRILVDSVWYVKEDMPDISLLGTKYVGYVVENSNFCFDAYKIYKDNGERLYPGITVKVTDKRSNDYKSWKTEEWDNDTFLINILNNDPVSLEMLKRLSFDDTIAISEPDDIKFLQAFLRLLTDMGWLNEKAKPSQI